MLGLRWSHYFTHNFVFNGINYLQKKGCTMGTKCAPSYENIFMGWFEEKFIFPLLTSYENIFMGWFEEKFIFALLTNLRDFYLRFIDNIFLIWNGTKTEFDNFLRKVNECHPSIKFEYENLNMKCLKQKSIFSTPQCLK